MNYISLIGDVAVWVTEVYRLFRTEPRMRPVISLSNFHKTKFFKIALAFMAVAAFGWLVGVVGAKKFNEMTPL
jgi:hypothetical protein